MGFIDEISKMYASSRPQFPSAGGPKPTIINLPFGTRDEGYGDIGKAIGTGFGGVLTKGIVDPWLASREEMRKWNEDPESLLKQGQMMMQIYNNLNPKDQALFLADPVLQGRMKIIQDKTGVLFPQSQTGTPVTPTPTTPTGMPTSTPSTIIPTGPFTPAAAGPPTSTVPTSTVPGLSIPRTVPSKDMQTNLALSDMLPADRNKILFAEQSHQLGAANEANTKANVLFPAQARNFDMQTKTEGYRPALVQAETKKHLADAESATERVKLLRDELQFKIHVEGSTSDVGSERWFRAKQISIAGMNAYTNRAAALAAKDASGDLDRQNKILTRWNETEVQRMKKATDMIASGSTPYTLALEGGDSAATTIGQMKTSRINILYPGGPALTIAKGSYDELRSQYMSTSSKEISDAEKYEKHVQLYNKMVGIANAFTYMTKDGQEVCYAPQDMLQQINNIKAELDSRFGKLYPSKK